MKIGKITSEQIFTPSSTGEGRVFSGMDVTAEFMNENGYVDVLYFRCEYLTNNLQGLVEKTLNTIFRNELPPRNVSNVRVIPKE